MIALPTNGRPDAAHAAPGQSAPARNARRPLTRRPLTRRPFGRRLRAAAAASLSVACLGALTAPAFASGGDATTTPTTPATAGEPGAGTPAPPPTTTHATNPSEAPRPSEPSTTKPASPTPASPTAAPKPGTTQASSVPGDRRVKVAAAIAEMVKAVTASAKLDAAVRDALLARLDAARVAAEAGRPLDNATMQALIRDVKAALGRGKGGDDHKDRKAATPTTSDDQATDTSEAEGSGDRHAPSQDGIVRLLDSAAAKVTASTLSDADKQALLGRIAAVKAKVDAGTPLGHEELGQLIGAVRAAVGGAGGHGDKHEGEHPEDAGKKPVDKALAEIDRQIAKIQASNLPADVKAKIVAALDEAKAKIVAGAATAGTDGGAAARTAIEDHRKAELDALSARLTAAADKIDAKLTTLAADPANDALVAASRAKLDQARELLTLSATPEDLRNAWHLLREVRQSLRVAEHPAAPESTTTTTTAPTVAPAPTDATAAPSPTEPSTTNP